MRWGAGPRAAPPASARGGKAVEEPIELELELDDALRERLYAADQPREHVRLRHPLDERDDVQRLLQIAAVPAPTSGRARYAAKCAAFSLDAAPWPSTTLPSRSTTSTCSGRSTR